LEKLLREELSLPEPALVSEPSTAVTVVLGTGWFGGVSAAAPDFWSTLLAVATILSVFVTVPFVFDDASHSPREAGGTIVVTAAEDKRSDLVNQFKLIKEEEIAYLRRPQLQVKGSITVV
jgi:hypothetical protein